MKIKLIEKYNVAIVELKGKLLGGPSAGELKDFFHKLIDEGKKNVIIDLSGVSYVNSSGIGMVIMSYTTVVNSGGKLVLANINEKMKGILSVTKLNQIFEIYSSTDEAIKSLS